MAVATFDTLKFANALKAAGVPEKQAEAEAAVLAEALQVNLRELATKEDLKALEDRIYVRLDAQETRLNVRIDAQETRLNVRIDAQETRFSAKIDLIKWMLGFVLTFVVAIVIRLFIMRSPI